MFARKSNAEIIVDYKNNKFLLHPGRLRYDWDLILKQVEGAFERGKAVPLPESQFYVLLNQLEFEREAYRADIEHAYGTQHRQLHEQHSDEPDWELRRAEHWDAYRAEVRRRRRWLDDIEVRLEEAHMRTLKQSRAG